MKIRYRLCHNYGGRLNRNGMAPVAVECRQGKRKIYISSGVMLYPSQWSGNEVVDHDNAVKLTAYLTRWMHEIEEIELDALLKGRQMTLYQLKNALKTGLRPSVTLRDFVKAVIDTSDRNGNTKQSYMYLVNELEREYGRLTLDDITHDLIEKWRTSMKQKGLSDNTVKGKLKFLRCIVNEALRRDVITCDSFKFITIGNMTPRKNDYLTQSEVRRLEKTGLEGRQAHIRDAFLFCVYTGCRYGDFIKLTSDSLKKDRLVVTQQKTGSYVEIPIRQLFGGKAMEILSRYDSIDQLADIGLNCTVNKILKDIAVKAGIRKKLHFHSSRKTCATLLNQAGLRMQEIQYILGHSRMSVTSKYYATTAFSQVSKSLKKAFKSEHF